MVQEKLGFEPVNEGEHVWMYIQKTQQNTQDIASALARQLGIPLKDVGYAGLKDKQAVTSQWFSALTNQSIAFQSLDLGNAHVLHSVRHHVKLKRGVHQHNDFQIIVRDVSDQIGAEWAIQRIRQQGVPNYFGEQRFGRLGQNIEKARALFNHELKPDRHQRGLFLSAARAFLFHLVLSERVKRGIWSKPITGDVLMLSGSNSFFKPQCVDEKIMGRLAEFDIHLSAPLWGKGKLASSDEARALELDVLEAYPNFTEGLARFGLRQQRRATRLIAHNLEYEWLSNDVLKLNFRLLKGGFATTVLRELLTINT